MILVTHVTHYDKMSLKFCNLIWLNTFFFLSFHSCKSQLHYHCVKIGKNKNKCLFFMCRLSSSPERVDVLSLITWESNYGCAAERETGERRKLLDFRPLGFPCLKKDVGKLELHRQAQLTDLMIVDLTHTHTPNVLQSDNLRPADRFISPVSLNSKTFNTASLHPRCSFSSALVVSSFLSLPFRSLFLYFRRFFLSLSVLLLSYDPPFPTLALSDWVLELVSSVTWSWGHGKSV